MDDDVQEEKEGLEREIHGLESQVAVLQQRASGTSTDVLGLERATAENTVLSALVHHQQFALATAQSMLAGCVVSLLAQVLKLCEFTVLR